MDAFIEGPADPRGTKHTKGTSVTYTPQKQCRADAGCPHLLEGEGIEIGALEPVDPEPVTHTFTAYPGGQYVKLTEKPVAESRSQRGGGPRGPNSDVYTHRMKGTFEKRLGKLNAGEPFDFVTLTYADNFDRFPERGFPCDPEVYQNDLTRFCDRLQYHYPVGLLWRLEFQKERGAPHFHLMLYGLTDRASAWVEAELSAMWRDVIGVEDDGLGVHVQRPKTDSERKKAMSYMIKRDAGQLRSPYIEHRARFWGWKGAKYLPEVEPEEIQLREQEAHALRRSMRTYRGKTSNYAMGAHPHNPSITLRRGCAQSWMRCARYYMGDREFVDTRNGEVLRQCEIDRLYDDTQDRSSCASRP